MFQPLSSILPKQFSYGLIATLLVFIIVFLLFHQPQVSALSKMKIKGDQALG